MTGAVLLTGANGSLAIPATEYLLSTYPMFTLVLTVRDDSDEDINTAELRRVVVRYPKANVIIRKLDLASLEEVQSFSHVLRLEIESGRLPRIVAIICNAFTWKLSGEAAYSKEGYETSVAVNHLAHFALSLRLLSSMSSKRGRIVFLGSEAHWPDRAGLSRGYPTKLPENLDLLVHPEPDQRSQEMGRGFQRYGMSKLIITMVMYELNRRLKTTRDTASIRAITIDPLNLIDSRTFRRSHVPKLLQIVMMVGGWLLPLLRLLQPSLASVMQAAKPVADIAVADEFLGQEGYFEGRLKTESSPDSLNEQVQKTLWERSVAWCKLEAGDTIVEI